MVDVEEALRIIKSSSRRKVSKEDAEIVLKNIGVLNNDGSFTKEYSFLKMDENKN